MQYAVQYEVLHEKVERARHEANARLELVDALREMEAEARAVGGEAAAERVQASFTRQFMTHSHRPFARCRHGHSSHSIPGAPCHHSTAICGHLSFCQISRS